MKKKQAVAATPDQEWLNPNMHKCANPRCNVLIPNWDKRVYHHANCKQAVYDQRVASETPQERQLRMTRTKYRAALRDLQKIAITPAKETITAFDNQSKYCKLLLTQIVELENQEEE
jgi:hypothetical protein